MRNSRKIKAGDLIRHPTTGEVGIVKKIIRLKHRDGHIVIVKTRLGRKRWKIEEPKESIMSKILSLISLR